MIDTHGHPFRSVPHPPSPPSLLLRALRLLSNLIPETRGARWRWWRRAQGGRWECVEWRIQLCAGAPLELPAPHAPHVFYVWCTDPKAVEYPAHFREHAHSARVIDVETWPAV